jgi:DNA polymerase-4
VDGHPERYRRYSEKVHAVLQSFSPQVEMVSIDEAFLDMTGTERLHGPPLRAAHALHQAIRERTGLNCSIGIAASRLVAKVCSDQAKPNGLLWILPGHEAAFLRPLAVRKIPGVGKVMEQSLLALGIRTVADLARLDESFLGERFGKWGLALAGKARGLDAGGWFDVAIGDREPAKSLSHEHTFSQDTADAQLLEGTLLRLAEMVGRRLREAGLHARTVQLKLRYQDFTTITRAHTLPRSTQLDTDLFAAARALFRAHWQNGRPIRLLGVHASSLDQGEDQLTLLEDDKQRRWRQALSAADHLRDKYGESAVELGGGLRARFRERVQENPAGLPGKDRKSGSTE